MFKIGDRVRRIGNSFTREGMIVGNIYTVREVCRDLNSIKVEGLVFYYAINFFELVKDESTMKYQPGDEVTIKLKVLQPFDYHPFDSPYYNVISEDIVRMPTPGSVWVSQPGRVSQTAEVHAVANDQVFRTSKTPDGKVLSTTSISLASFLAYYEPA